MKKLMMVLVMEFAAAMPLTAETETVGDYTWSYRINGDTAEIINEDEYEEDTITAISPKPTGAVTIPSILGGKPVTSIGDRAFLGCSGLTSVTIPDSVTNIGYEAFYNCTNLTSVTIPDSVTSIGAFAFSGTPFYDNQPDGLVVFGKVTYKMKGVCPTIVTIPDGVTGIGSRAFYNCSGLTSVTIPNSVTDIGSYAFSGCSGLTSVTIPNSVTDIGEGAFSGCSGLKDVTVPFVGVRRGNSGSPDSVFGYIFGKPSYSVGLKMYQQYSSSSDYYPDYYYIYNIPSKLTKVVITDETVLGYMAFYHCSGLTSVTIPNSVTNIGASAFSGCSGLTSVAIPNSVTSIGEWAFSGCSGLTGATIPDSVTSIGNSAFSGCSGLTSVTIPDSVTSIGGAAFNNCTGLRSIKLPSGFFSLGSGAFDNTPAYNIAQLRPLMNADGVLGGSLTTESPTGSALSSGSSSGGGSSAGGSSGGYALSDIVGDSTIASMTVSSDTSIDSFLLTDGHVFDMAIRIVNVAESAVRLTLPSGYDYETMGTIDPLEIPASSTNMVTITRTAAKTFLVSRQVLRPVQ